MNNPSGNVRNAKPSEFASVGKLMVNAYNSLEGFPKANEQPGYFHMLANVGELTKQPGTELLVAVDDQDNLLGAVVFYHDMQYYGAGGTAKNEKNACGFRLLAVDPKARGRGIGKMLTGECIRKAKANHVQYLLIHTTAAMQIAWQMYEKLGFKRAADLDFRVGEFPVYGFRLKC